jgi:hypothetical protein
MTREEFLVYMDHFNNKRFDEIIKYFSPDVRFQYHTRFTNEPQEVRVRYGPEGFVKHYKDLSARIRERLDLGLLLSSDDGKNLFVELYTEFHALEDTVFTAGPMRKGDVFCCTNFVLYDLDEDGKFTDVKIAHWRVEDPAKARL